MSKFTCSHGVSYPASCHRCVEHVLAHDEASIKALTNAPDPEALVQIFGEMLQFIDTALHSSMGTPLSEAEIEALIARAKAAIS